MPRIFENRASPRLFQKFRFRSGSTFAGTKCCGTICILVLSWAAGVSMRGLLARTPSDRLDADRSAEPKALCDQGAEVSSPKDVRFAALACNCSRAAEGFACSISTLSCRSRPPRGGVDWNRSFRIKYSACFVAPHAGAWIGTKQKFAVSVSIESPPTRGRGLELNR